MKYIVTTNKDKSETHYLYDLRKDPCEQTNLVDDYPEVVKRLQDQLKGWESELWNERQRSQRKR